MHSTGIHPARNVYGQNSNAFLLKNVTSLADHISVENQGATKNCVDKLGRTLRVMTSNGLTLTYWNMYVPDNTDIEIFQL